MPDPGLHILYLGPLAASLTEHLAVSPAANRWQVRFLSALTETGADVRCVGYLPEPAWPRGRLLIDPSLVPVSTSMAPMVGYLNLPYARGLFAASSLLRAAWPHRDAQLPDATLTYNAPVASIAVALALQELRGVPWIPLIADVAATPTQRRVQTRILNRAAARVFFSHAGAEAGRRPSLFFEGGIDPCLAPREPQRPRAFMFAGALNRYSGINLLLDAFRLVRTPDIELWISGRGNERRVREAVAEDSRIRYLGLLSEPELEDAMGSAFAFVNPRPSSLDANALNFPSKLLHYLSFARPIVSTWTPGLSPEYRDVLCLAAANTALGLASALEKVASLGDLELVEHRKRIVQFQSRRSWPQQAQRFVGWLKSAVVDRR